MQILLVEDSEIFRDAFKQELAERCPLAAVAEAADGEEAMQEIIKAPPQIIFMDFRLPGKDGIQLTKEIKARFPDVRIAMLTSYELPEYREAAIRSGADRYFIKHSFSWEEVDEFIECGAA